MDICNCPQLCAVVESRKYSGQPNPTQPIIMIPGNGWDTHALHTHEKSGWDTHALHTHEKSGKRVGKCTLCDTVVGGTLVSSAGFIDH